MIKYSMVDKTTECMKIIEAVDLQFSKPFEQSKVVLGWTKSGKNQLPHSLQPHSDQYEKTQLIHFTIYLELLCSAMLRQEPNVNIKHQMPQIDTFVRLRSGVCRGQCLLTRSASGSANTITDQIIHTFIHHLPQFYNTEYFHTVEQSNIISFIKIKMNKNRSSMEDYMATSSLFRTQKNKFVSAYPTYTSNHYYNRVPQIQTDSIPTLFLRSLKQHKRQPYFQQTNHNQPDIQNCMGIVTTTAKKEVQQTHQYQLFQNDIPPNQAILPVFEPKQQKQTTEVKLQHAEVHMANGRRGSAEVPVAQQDELNRFNSQSFPVQNNKLVDNSFHQYRTEGPAHKYDIFGNSEPSSSNRNSLLVRNAQANQNQGIQKEQLPTAQKNQKWKIKSGESSKLGVTKGRKAISPENLEKEQPVYTPNFLELEVNQRDNQSANRDNSKSFRRMAPISSVSPNSILILQNSKETLQLTPNNSTSNHVEGKVQGRDSFFWSTKRDAEKYLFTVSSRLKESYQRLDTIEQSIDALIDRNLQLQCEKIKNRLLRLMESELRNFKEGERRQLNQIKFSYMAGLYEIKSNIDLRLEELQQYTTTLRHEGEWRQVVNSLLTPNYDHTIQFLVSKSQDIEDDSLASINELIVGYNNRIESELNEPLRVSFLNSVEKIMKGFNSSRKKSSIVQQIPHPAQELRVENESSSRHEDWGQNNRR